MGIEAKYVTVGIREKIGIDLQVYMWVMVEKLENQRDIQTDYLQVFNFKTKEGKWRNPPRDRAYTGSSKI